MLQDIGHLPLFDDDAVLHHHDPVGDRPDNTEIMADEQIGQTMAVTKLCQKVEICARIETSSAETASSRMISRGRMTSARAIAIR